MVVESDETKIAVLVEKVGNMSTVLNKLDGKFDTISDKFATKEDMNDLKKKVTSLEGWRIWLVGIATGIATLIAFIKDWIFQI